MKYIITLLLVLLTTGCERPYDDPDVLNNSTTTVVKHPKSGAIELVVEADDGINPIRIEKTCYYVDRVVTIVTIYELDPSTMMIERIIASGPSISADIVNNQYVRWIEDNADSIVHRAWTRFDDNCFKLRYIYD